MIEKIYIFARRESIFYKQKKQAKRALKSIRNQTKYKLTSEQKKDINRFCKNVLKSKRYKPWLKVYTIFNQEFKWGWMPDEFLSLYTFPKNNPFGYVATIKTISKSLLKNAKEIPDAFYIINGQFYDADIRMVDKENIMNDENVLFYKKNSSGHGRDIIKITQENFGKVFGNKYADGVLQNAIKQHSWFNKVMPDNVCTVRITTTNFNGNVKYLAGTLRAGRSGLDGVQSKTAIKIPIIDGKGNLSEWGMTPDFKKIKQHPDTKFVFKNEQIPFFDKMVARCLELHAGIPYFGIVGWDCIIDENNEMKIMEYNAKHPDIIFHELAVGPCFDKEIFDIK